MGRVKLQIKKIENTTNRQVTFSKRRNGLIKKAYELSVLCDVDVALIMFSPSGRVSTFSGNNRSVEEILDRYVNLPEHERGRLQNQEYLQRALGKLRGEVGQVHEVPSPTSSDSQLEEVQNELAKCKSQLEDLEKKLRIFEGELSGIATLDEAEYRENILEETLGHLRIHKQSLMEKYNPFSTPPTSSQVHIPTETLNTNGYVDGISSKMIMDWIPQRDPQAQILNFLDSNGLLPLRNSSPRVSEMLQLSSSSLVLGQSAMMNIENHMSPGSGIDDNCNVHHRSEFGQVVDVNLSQWPEFYSTGNDAYPESQPRGRESAELFSSPFT